MTLLLSALLLLAGPVRAQDEGDGTQNVPGMISTGGYVVFYNAEGPLSMITEGRRPAGSVALGEVTGKSCQHGLSIPLSASLRSQSVSGAAGDGSYRKAVWQIEKDHPGLTGLYDVKVDIRHLSVLGVYRRRCTIVTARGYR